MPQEDRLERQLRFVEEMDRLKQVRRQTLLMDASRPETSAEHSWHVAVMALVLAEYAGGEGLDLLRVLQMLLLHDIVEIDAGDTYCYDPEGLRDQAERESRAADRIFGLLPSDQGRRLQALWEEYEGRQTPEARFAHALDCLQPLLHNIHTRGKSWKGHGIRRHQVLERNQEARRGAPALWTLAVRLIDQAVKQGLLAE